MGENRVEYKRVDEEDDKYKRILVKFNPKFLRGSDFEIEFIPLEEAIHFGNGFVTNVDGMGNLLLYRWENRRQALLGQGDFDPGTLLSIDENVGMAEDIMELWRMGKFNLEPRQIIAHVKNDYKGISDSFSGETACAYNWYLCSGQLGALPFGNPYFTVKLLKKCIEEFSFLGKNRDGDVIDRPFVRHINDTRETEYADVLILNYLEAMRIIQEELAKKHGEE